MCVNPITIRNPRIGFDSYIDDANLVVPCNHCYDCQRNKQYDLEIRSVAEFERCMKVGGAVYNYTLTYNDEYLPRYFGVPVLARADIQLFKKRLLKRYPYCNLRVQYAGEYGKDKDRPHWHILIYSDKSIDASIMYKDVREVWSVPHGFHYVDAHRKNGKKYRKRVYDFVSRGFVGLPSKFDNGRLLPYIPQNALLSNIHAIKYCIKYCFKSYNFYNSLFCQFRTKLFELGVDNGDVFKFCFPPDPYLGVDDCMSIRDVCNHFSKCFRNPINFGMAQLDMMDDDMVMNCEFSNDGNEFLTYNCSQYLRNKLFHISCVYDKDVKQTRYSRKWYEYMKKNIEDICQNKTNYYICNQNIELLSEIRDFTKNEILKNCRYVKDVLDYISSTFDCNLFDYFRYSYLSSNPFMRQYTNESILYYKYKRIAPCVHDDIDTFLYGSARLKLVLPLLNACNQSIKYRSYVDNVKKYNDRQSLIALEYASKNRGYKPRYIDILPFNKYINLKSLTIKDVKANY